MKEIKSKRISPSRTFNYEKVKQFIENDSESACKLLTLNSTDLRGASLLKLECSCGKPFETTYSRFTNKRKPKRQCNECALEGKKNSYEKVKSFIEENSDCVLLTEYKPKIESKETIKLLCVCGKEFPTTFNQFQDGKRKCNKCSNHHIWTFKEVEEYIQTESNCILLSEEKDFHGVDSYIDLICEICGEPYSTTFSIFHYKKIHNCWQCGRDKWSEGAKFSLEEIEGIVGSNNCKLISAINYKNTSSIIEIKCSCGEPFKTSLGRFMSKDNPKDKCDKCSSSISRGELSVKDFLEQNNFDFQREYKFKDCRNKLPLPFDFVVFGKDMEISFLIEYDGEQHFKPIKHWGGEKGFLYRKQNDKIKNEYCENNKIHLVRIPYYEKDIEGYLIKNLRLEVI